MKNRILSFFVISIAICIFLFGTLVAYSDPGDAKINNEQTTPFNDDWRFTVNGEATETPIVDLPHKFVGKKDDVLRITKKLPTEYTEGMTMCFRSSQEFVRVYVDDRIIYEYGYDSYRPFGKSPGSAYNFVRLSRETAGKYLTIELVSPYDAYAKLVPEVNYGSKNSNVFNILSRNFASALISSLIILVGAVLFIAHWYFYKNTKNNALLYLSLFAILSGIWTLLESRLVQFVFNDQTALTMAAFWTLMLFPIPLLQFISNTYTLHNKRYFNLLSYLFLGHFAVASILQILNIVDFIEFPLILHGLILVSATYVIYTLLVEIIRYKNKQMFLLSIGALILAACAFLDLFSYYGIFMLNNSFFCRIGVLIYILILAYNSIETLLVASQKNMENTMLEQLAYLDFLTKLKNRTSFELCMENYRKDVLKCDDVAIGIFDINGLKQINDIHGHKVGDDIIIQAAKCLMQTFSGIGDIFRIGGDEFALICEKSQKDVIAKRLEVFVDLVEITNAKLDVKLSVAHGVCIFDHNLDVDIDNLYIRADEIMYDKKTSMKEYVDKIK